MSIHLISYGNDHYASQKKFFRETAEASRFFDTLVMYGPEEIAIDFRAKFQLLLNQQKGGGYWVWKPYILKKCLANLAEDDLLIYCDTGCMINLNGKERFAAYIELLMESKFGSIAFELPHAEIEYTKQEVFDYYHSSPAIVNSNQLMATVILLRKCKHATQLLDEWYQVLFQQPLLFTDDLVRSRQHPRYLTHRHDQSIFSVIRKTYGTEIIADETYFLDFFREGQAYPFWSAHLR